MRNSFVLFALVLAVLGALSLHADPLPERKSGKVLLLRNQRTLEGDIERLGDRFRIRRKQGELWIPAADAAYLGSDWNDAFSFMAAQANMLDPDERIRLAKWCQANGLHDLALKEVVFALELRPKDTQAQRLKEMLQQQVRSAEKRTTEAITPATYAPPPSLDVGVQSLAMFASRVQPILINTCLPCHQPEKSSRFQLFPTTQMTYRHALENNLVSALAQIDTEHPELSPLLCKAVSKHGGDHSPLKGRDTIPYQTLQAWVAQVIDSNPQLRIQRTAAPSVQPREVPHLHMTPPAEPPTAVATKPPSLFAANDKAPELKPGVTETPKTNASETLKPNASEAPKSHGSEALKPVEPNAQPAYKPAQSAAAPRPDAQPNGLPNLHATPLAEKAVPPSPNPTRSFGVAPPPAPSVQAAPPPAFDAYDPSAFNKKMHPQRP